MTVPRFCPRCNSMTSWEPRDTGTSIMVCCLVGLILGVVCFPTVILFVIIYYAYRHGGNGAQKCAWCNGRVYWNGSNWRED